MEKKEEKENRNKMGKKDNWSVNGVLSSSSSCARQMDEKNKTEGFDSEDMLI